MADQLSPCPAVHSQVQSAVGPLAALVGTPVNGAADTHSPVILMVPGYTGSKEDFAPIVDPLVRAGFGVIAIDQPGQYESPGPDDETAYTPAVLGLVLSSVVSHLALDHQVIVLGHSFGGLVSRAALLDGAPASGLVMLCSGPAKFVGGARFDALTRGEQILRVSGAAELYDGNLRAAGQDPDDPDPLARFFRRRFLASNPAALLGMGRALLTEPDRTAELATSLQQAGIPAAVIAGEGDDAWPLAAQRRMAETLGTELVLVPGGAHSPAVEAPDELVRILIPLLRSWL